MFIRNGSIRCLQWWLVTNVCRAPTCELMSTFFADNFKPDLLEAHRGIIAMQIAAGKPEEAFKEAKSIQIARPKEAIRFAMEGDVFES